MLSVMLIGSSVACGQSTNQPSSSAASSTTAEGKRRTGTVLLENLRFHWSADPGIDLVSGVAVPLRAYLESYTIASSTTDIANVYPGFMRATPENEALDGDYVAQLAWVRPLNGLRTDEKPAAIFGYTPFHILRVDPDGAGLRATICEGKYASYVKSTVQPGKYVSVAAQPETATPIAPDSLIAVHRIELSEDDPRAVANPPLVSVPQQGPAVAPATDVFGRWFITGASSTYWGPITAPGRETVATPELLRQCGERMPEPPDVRAEMAAGFKDEPPAGGAAIPGWPKSSS